MLISLKGLTTIVRPFLYRIHLIYVGLYTSIGLGLYDAQDIIINLKKMKQILQRRINNCNKSIIALKESEDVNQATVNIFTSKLNLYKELLKEHNSLQKIQSIPKNSRDILIVLLIFAEQFEYSDDDIVDLMIDITSRPEIELVDFVIETYKSDIEDWKQAHPDWRKYF